ncbi:hypothetical protein [Rhizobium rhizogenes]|uniref:hypothetical protein n=1 Tax=Rhizobium rhizogenes TaxID=359 RepID=UPI0022B737D4|nr:hypothetical protein [Rhizobium rhizogenes]MCZ7448137.1 hypothetical protein [Rhizobium rhizogenes]MCZ7465798.1 hypothetical protein [Rhizobium rhizogenes]
MIRTGVIRTISASVENEEGRPTVVSEDLVERRLWEGSKLTPAFLRRYLQHDQVSSVLFDAMFEYEQTFALKEWCLSFVSYALNVEVAAIPDETADLLMALLFTVRKIVESGAQGKQRMAKAYHDARSLMATMDRHRGSARPPVEACLEHFNLHKNADNAAAAGWMLAAIQERVSERNLYGWRRLGEIADAAVRELLPSEQASLH